MKSKTALTLSTFIASILALQGCGSSFLQIGRSAPASAQVSTGGFYGTPNDIIKYKAVIKKIQEDYKNSGYKTPLVFRINNRGVVFVKRDDEKSHWQLYRGSIYEAEITKGLIRYRRISNQYSRNVNNVGYSYPNNNLESVRYVDSDIRNRYLRNRSDTGVPIRTNGRIQKIWIAPVKTKQGDLVSAHTIYAEVEKPKWVIGEETPRPTKEVNMATPMPSSIKHKKFGSYGGETVRKYVYNTNKVKNTKEGSNLDNKSKTNNNSSSYNNIIQNYINNN